MAIAFDANLGSTDGSLGGTQTLTTTAPAAANSRIVALISYFSGANPTACSIGGTAATNDKRATNGSDKFDIWSLNSAGGLASGSSISFTGMGTAGGWLIGAMSLTGVASSGAVVTTSSSATTGANWSSGSATNTGFANAVYVGGAGNEDATAATTSTATSGTEVHDRYRTADQQGLATGYKIVSTVASDSVAGTFSNSASTANTGALVIYAAAAGGAAAASPPIQRSFPRALLIS